MRSGETDKLAYRLAAILSKLYKGESLKRQQLVEEFGVTERTIYRDIDRLDTLVETDEAGHYRLRSAFKCNIQTQHVEALVALLGAQDLFSADTLDRLVKNLESPNKTSSYLVKGPAYEQEMASNHDFKLLDHAIQQGLICHLRYTDKARSVEPYRLINHMGIWYLAAVENGGLKAFSLSRCSNILPTEERFAIDSAIANHISQSDGIWFGSRTLVTLKVTGLAQHYFSRRQLLPHQKTLHEGSGHLLLSCEISHPEQLLPIVRYWVPHVRIEEPAHFNDMLKETLSNYLQSM